MLLGSICPHHILDAVATTSVSAFPTELSTPGLLQVPFSLFFHCTFLYQLQKLGGVHARYYTGQ